MEKIFLAGIVCLMAISLLAAVFHILDAMGVKIVLMRGSRRIDEEETDAPELGAEPRADRWPCPNATDRARL